MSRDEIESSYKISRRIEGEERALDVAMMVFTSTQQEVSGESALLDAGLIKSVLRRSSTRLLALSLSLLTFMNS